MGFVLTLNEGVKGKKLSVEYTVSEVGAGVGCPSSCGALLSASGSAQVFIMGSAQTHSLGCISAN